MTRYIAARVDEIPPGGRKIVEIGGREVGVFNVDGRFYALRNRCPHQSGPLCQGSLVGQLSSPAPGQYEFERQGEILRCPWHQWEFDLRTGQSWFDPDRVRVRRYPASVASGAALGDGDVWAGTVSGDAEAEEASEGLSSADATGRGREPGPYLAETYPTLVEDRYVLVDLGR